MIHQLSPLDWKINQIETIILFYRCLLTCYLMCQVCFALCSWRIFFRIFVYFIYSSKALWHKMNYTLKMLCCSEFKFALLFKNNVPLLIYWNSGQQSHWIQKQKQTQKTQGAEQTLVLRNSSNFTGLGIMAQEKEDVSYHTQRAMQGGRKKGRAHVPA